MTLLHGQSSSTNAVIVDDDGRRDRMRDRLVDTAGDERPAVFDRVTGVTDAVRPLQSLERALEARRLVSREREQGLAGRHRVARLRVQVDPCGVLYRVLLARAACSKTPGGDAERQRLLCHEHAGALSG